MSEEIEPHILKRYELIKKLGSGAYGHVWKVQERKTKQILALKKIFDAFQHSTDAQRTFREIMFLRQFNHPQIIKLKCLHRAQNDKDIYLVFQYMQADLHGVIRQNILKPLHKQFIIYQIVKAVKYLHSAQLIHRDLKPSNVLLNSNCKVKLCDFGLVRSIEGSKGQEPVLTQYVATRWYRAPQLLLGSTNYSKAVDLWSLGCMIGEIARGKPLFPGNSTMNQLQRILTFTGWPQKQDIESMSSSVAQSILGTLPKIKKTALNEWFPKAPGEMVDLIDGLLQFNPKKRLNINEVLKHPYLQQFYNGKEEDSQKKINLYIGDFDRLPVGAYRGLLYQMMKSQNQPRERSNILQLDKQLNKSERLRDKRAISDKHTTEVMVVNSKNGHSSIEYKDKKFAQPKNWSVPKKTKQKRYESSKIKAQYVHSMSRDRASQQSHIVKSKRPKRHSLADNMSQEKKQYITELIDDNGGSKRLNQIIIKVPRCTPVNATFIQYSQYLKGKKRIK